MYVLFISFRKRGGNIQLVVPTTFLLRWERDHGPTAPRRPSSRGDDCRRVPTMHPSVSFGPADKHLSSHYACFVIFLVTCSSVQLRSFVWCSNWKLPNTIRAKCYCHGQPAPRPSCSIFHQLALVCLNMRICLSQEERERHLYPFSVNALSSALCIRVFLPELERPTICGPWGRGNR